MQKIYQARPEPCVNDDIKIRVDPTQSQLSEWQTIQRMKKNAVDYVHLECRFIAGVGGDGERDIEFGVLLAHVFQNRHDSDDLSH